MIIYEGMQPNQAVKCGDNYVVHLPSGNYSIDGVEVTANYQGHQFLVKDLESIKKVSPSVKSISHYVGKDGTIYTEEELQEARLQRNQYWDDDYDEYVFPSLEKEFEIRKLMEPFDKAVPQYTETEKTIEDYSHNITVIGEQIDTGSKFISTAYSVGRVNHKGFQNGVFKVSSNRVMMDQFNQIMQDNKDWKFDVPTHSFLHYAKINGKYIFTDKQEYNGVNDRVFLDLDSAVEYEKSLRKMVSKDVYSKMSTEKLGLLRGEMYVELQSVHRRLLALDVKQKDRSSKTGLLSSVKKLYERLEVGA